MRERVQSLFMTPTRLFLPVSLFSVLLHTLAATAASDPP
jgi:hypothetical protein